MSKILILAPSGFGKSTSIGAIPELGLQGLNPETTFVVSATSKPLPFKGSSAAYKVIPKGTPPVKESGNRYITNDGNEMAKVISYVVDSRPEITDIVIDDFNYVMQDYYMANAMKGGYDVFKKIGQFMDGIFSAMERAVDKNIICLAHYEEYKDTSNDTVGKMVQDYITPEGKFDIVLFGKQSIDSDKKVVKQFVTNFDGQFPSKSPVGMFDEMYVPNDLGLVTRKVREYYN
jgi:hypothetical protein